MSRHNRRKSVARVLATAVVGSLMLASVAAAILLPRHVLALRWARQLERLPDDELLARMRQLAALEEAGIPALVESLGSEREAVAGSARAVLHEQVEQWRGLPPQESSRRAAVLARSLASHVDELNPAGQSVCAALAERLLTWPASSTARDGSRTIADCQYVLRAAREAANETPTDSVAQSNANGSLKGGASEAPRGAGFGLDSDDAEIPGLPRLPSVGDMPGGNLPMESALVPPLPAGLEGNDADWFRLSDAPHQDMQTGPSRSVAAPRTLQPDNARRISPERNSASGEPAPPALLEDLDDEAPGTLPRVEAQQLPAPDRAQAPSLDELDRAGVMSVVALLRSGDEQVVQAAAHELARRGFTDEELTFSRQIAGADPDGRRELVRLLPRLGQIDARQWLLWLSHDEDAGVRLAAVTVMATSRDPQLLDRLRAMQSTERNPDILRQLERVRSFEK